MYYTVTKAKYIDGYKIRLTFKNKKRGVVDFTKHTEYGGVFDRFKDLNYFKQAYVDKESGTLCWPDEVDVAPETLYHEATGEPLPAWMEPDPAQPPQESKFTPENS